MGVQGNVENFSEEQRKRITCSICLEIYEEPVEVACCRHVFCKSCILSVSAASRESSCPICRKKLDVERLTKAHPFILEHLSTARMSCPFQACAESNSYDAHINHLKICSKGPETECRFCKENFARMKFEDHLENCVERYKELVKKAEYLMSKLRLENLHLREKLANAEKRAQVNTPAFQNYDQYDLLE